MSGYLPGDEDVGFLVGIRDCRGIIGVMEGADVSLLDGEKDRDGEVEGCDDGKSEEKSEGETLGDFCRIFEGPSEMKNGSFSSVMLMRSTSKGVS